MRIYRISQKLKGNYRPAAAAIGLFDGVHLGHQKLLQKALKLAREGSLDSAVITFEPDPAEIYRTNGKITHLNTSGQKYRHFQKMGISRVYVIQFDSDFSKLSPEEFIEYLNRLNVRELVCGFDFSFGSKGRGNCELLKNSDKRHFGVSVIDCVDHQGEKISSTRIINAIKAGNIETANTLLGYQYTVEDPDCQVIPKDGLYQGMINGKRAEIAVNNGVIANDSEGENRCGKLNAVFEKRI